MKVATVSDASPLIYLARLEMLEFLHTVLGPVGLSPAVFQETVVAGRYHGYPDAERIASAIQRGYLVVLHLNRGEVKLVTQLQEDPRLGLGECETIACAMQRGFKAILHDKKARWVAAERGVRTIHAVDILFLGLLRGHIYLTEFKIMLRNLARVIGMDPATLLEREALADEIKTHLGYKGDKNYG